MAANQCSYKPLIVEASEALGIDPGLTTAIVHAESAFDPNARSQSNAIGLMQLLQTEGASHAYLYLFGTKGTPTESALFDPAANIWLGTAYLHLLHSEYFKSSPPAARSPLVVAAYNWGPGNVQRLLESRQAQPKSPQESLRFLENHAPNSVYQFVRKVLSPSSASVLAHCANDHNPPLAGS